MVKVLILKTALSQEKLQLSLFGQLGARLVSKNYKPLTPNMPNGKKNTT
jgi:hypothetical protein